MNFVRSNNISLKYQRFTTLDSKDIRIIKSEFVAKTQFLFRQPRFYSVTTRKALAFGFPLPTHWYFVVALGIHILKMQRSCFLLKRSNYKFRLTFGWESYHGLQCSVNLKYQVANKVGLESLMFREQQ